MDFWISIYLKGHRTESPTFRFDYDLAQLEVELMTSRLLTDEKLVSYDFAYVGPDFHLNHKKEDFVHTFSAISFILDFATIFRLFLQ